MSGSAPVVANGPLKAFTGLLASWGLTMADVTNIFSLLAAMLSAAYALVVLLEWMWKKFLRKWCETRGLVKARKRRAIDREEIASGEGECANGDK